MNLLQNGKVGLGGGASIYTCYMLLCRVGFQEILLNKTRLAHCD